MFVEVHSEPPLYSQEIQKTSTTCLSLNSHNNKYNHPNKEVAVLKSNLNDEYYPIELILGGEAKGMKDMIDEGLEKLENL